jgi:hypothetical protein
MPVDSYIQVPPDGVGKKIRAIQETNLSGDVVYSKVVKVSGETVVAKVSGEVVRSSGEIYIAKVSGEVVKVSGETVVAKMFGYDVAAVSGAVISNIVSGQVVLHTITINDRTSGYYMTVYNSCSGATGTPIAFIFAASRVLEPSTLIFDVVMLSGIVVATSGATWHASVTYKRN